MGHEKGGLGAQALLAYLRDKPNAFFDPRSMPVIPAAWVPSELPLPGAPARPNNQERKGASLLEKSKGEAFLCTCSAPSRGCGRAS
jgi:hypothetical protein